MVEDRIDTFFFYGEPGSDIGNETRSDLLSLLIQDKRSMFFNRQFGCDITKRENIPNAVTLFITTRFDIVNAVSFRNTTLPDEQGSPKDRRVAVSQTSINFISGPNGVDMEIKYIPFSKNQKARPLQLPIGFD